MAGNLRAYIAGFGSGARDVLDKFDFDTQITRLAGNDDGSSRPRRLARALDAKDVAKIAQEFALSADGRSLLLSRGAVVVSGPIEQGAHSIWCAKRKAAEEVGARAARDIGFYCAPGDSGFHTILSVLHGFGIPWVVVCDGKSFDVETNWSNHIFRQIEQAGIDFTELKQFTDRAGRGGKESSTRPRNNQGPWRNRGRVDQRSIRDSWDCSSIRRGAYCP